MKILVFLDKNPFYGNNASSNRWRGMIDGLPKGKVSVLLIIFQGYHDIEEFRLLGRRGKIKPSIDYFYINFQVNSNVWLRRINIFFLDRINRYLNIFRVRNIIKSFRPDFIFINPSLLVFKTVELIPEHFLRRSKLMMEINEFNDIRDSHARNAWQIKNNELYNYYLKDVILPRLDICLVMTTALQRHFSQFEKLKSKICFYHLPMSVDLGRFKDVNPTNKYQRPYVAYCGTSSFTKDGVDILIRAFELIAHRNPHLRLYIAAFWESDGSRMMKLIENSVYRTRISYLGELGREEVVELIQNATICGLPRPNSRQAQGGFPTKLGEYLATGNPVCVTKVGEIPFYLEDGVSCFLASPGSVEDFALVLQRALENPEFSNDVGLRGKQVAEKHFNIESQGKELYSFLLEQLI